MGQTGSRLNDPLDGHADQMNNRSSRLHADVMKIG